MKWMNSCQNIDGHWSKTFKPKPATFSQTAPDIHKAIFYR